jgi:hypothetical protein
MCSNEKCQSLIPTRIEDHRIDDQTMNTTAILQMYELSRYEEGSRVHPELSTDVDEQLIHVLFEVRKLCWECARPTIEEAMGWKFDLLDQGISLDKHEEIIEFLDCFQPLDEEWNHLLVWVFLERKIEFHDHDELQDQLIALQSKDVAAESVRAMAEWLRQMFSTQITIEELVHCVDAGFVTSEDLELLNYDNLKWDIENLNPLPSKKVLLQFGIDGNQFHQYMEVLLTLEAVAEYPTELEIVTLVETGATLSQLSCFRDYLDDSLDSEWAESNRSESLQSIFDQLNDDDCNFKGISAYKLFSRTVKALIDAGLVLSYENLARYWDLSSQLILFVIDHDLLTDDTMRIARLVETPAELLAWLELGTEVIAVDEIHEWVLAGFNADDAAKWKLEGFDAAIARQWSGVIDDPVIALRRRSAGIQPPEVGP